MTLKTLFNDRYFFRTLGAIAVPIIFQNLIQSFVNMLDTVMVGQLGEVAIAAVGLGNQVFFLLNMILFGIASGASIFTAQYWGKKDIAGIRRTLGLSLSAGVGLSCVFMFGGLFFPRAIIGLYSADAAVISEGAAYLRVVAFSYPVTAVSFVFAQMLRSVERVKLSMTATVISFVVNGILNYLFIFGVPGLVPAMGVRGAAAATIAARLVEVCILLLVTYKKRYPPAGTLRELFSFSRSFTGKYLRIAFPVIVNETLWSFGITMHNGIFARAGTAAIAAFNITSTISQLTWVFFIGVGNAAAVIIGKKIGEGDNRTAYDYADRFVLLMPVMSVCIGIFLLPLSKTLPFFFRVDAEVIRQASLMLVVLMCTYPFKSFNMCMVVGICRSGGDTVFAAVCDVLFMWTVAIPLGAVAALVWKLPAWVVYICILSEEPVKAVAGFLRFKSGKWLHNIT